MSAPSENVVRFAATLLPAPMRDRYREQWLGELRDAEEVGIPRAEIAMAALTFAASLDRPFLGVDTIPHSSSCVARAASAFQSGAPCACSLRASLTISISSRSGPRDRSPFLCHPHRGEPAHNIPTRRLQLPHPEHAPTTPGHAHRAPKTSHGMVPALTRDTDRARTPLCTQTRAIGPAGRTERTPRTSTL